MRVPRCLNITNLKELSDLVCRRKRLKSTFDAHKFASWRLLSTVCFFIKSLSKRRKKKEKLINLAYFFPTQHKEEGNYPVEPTAASKLSAKRSFVATLNTIFPQSVQETKTKHFPKAFETRITMFFWGDAT